VVAAAYTYNKKDDKLTTNFAIDRNGGNLVTMGSAEGVQPVVSFNTGQLFTVGAIGVADMVDASMDIADVSGAAFAAIRLKSHATTRLYSLDLQTGKGTFDRHHRRWRQGAGHGCRTLIAMKSGAARAHGTCASSLFL